MTEHVLITFPNEDFSIYYKDGQPVIWGDGHECNTKTLFKVLNNVQYYQGDSDVYDEYFGGKLAQLDELDLSEFEALHES